MTPETATISPARGFIAEHAHYHDDDVFWLTHARRLGGPVLDLGAAAGRIAVPVAALGVQVTAVDADAEMLDVLLERARSAGVAGAIMAVPGDMADVPLPTGIALAIVPMNTLQVLVEPSARTSTFTRVASALQPGGEFIFDLSVPDLDDIAARLGDVIPTATHRDADAGALLMHTAVYDHLDATTRTLRFRVIVDRLMDDGTRAHDERAHTVHLYTPDEVEALVAAAGLEVLSVHAGFHGEPFDPPASERQVWRCRKPGGAR